MSKKEEKESRFDDFLKAARAKKRDADNSEGGIEHSDVETSEHLNAQTSESLNAPTPKSKDPNFQRTTVYLPKALHKKLRAAAISEEREMSDVIEELVTQWLDQKQQS